MKMQLKDIYNIGFYNVLNQSRIQPVLLYLKNRPKDINTMHFHFVRMEC